MKIILLSLFFLVTKVFAADKSDDSKGPFRSVLLSVWRCQNSTYPLEKDPPIKMNMWAINSGTPRSRLLSANITVLKETKQVRLKIKRFTWEGGKWKLTHSMNGITCHGMLLDILCKAVGFKMLDTSKCAFVEGMYTINGLNINTIQHMITSKMEYGQTLWRTEINVGFSTYHCWEFQTLVEKV